MADPAPLAGLTVVVTRPEPAAGATRDALQRAGADTLSMPVLAIDPLDSPLNAQLVAGLGGAVFVSVNAVEFGLPRLRAAGFGATVPCFAVGDTTARALRAAGQADVVSPQHGFDSEHLLQVPRLKDPRGMPIIIVKGEGRTAGRALIEQTLAGRGAVVTAWVCYRRRALPVEASVRDELASKLAAGAEVLVLAASVESFEALCEAWGGDAPRLSRAIFAVPHARVAGAVSAASGARTVVVPLSPEALVGALVAGRRRGWRHEGEHEVGHKDEDGKE